MKRYIFRMSGMVDVEAHALELEAKAADGSDTYAAWMRAEAEKCRKETADVYVKLEDVRALIEASRIYEDVHFALLEALDAID